MIKSIQEHHNAEEIETIRLQNDIKQWKSELEFVSHELEFYIDIFNSSVINRAYSEIKKAKYLLNQFYVLSEINEKTLKECETFHPKLEEMNECEDIQCDHAYLNEHSLLRLKIERHISEVRNVKYSAFTFLKNRIEEFLN